MIPGQTLEQLKLGAEELRLAADRDVEMMRRFEHKMPTKTPKPNIWITIAIVIFFCAVAYACVLDACSAEPHRYPIAMQRELDRAAQPTISVTPGKWSETTAPLQFVDDISTNGIELPWYIRNNDLLLKDVVDLPKPRVLRVWVRSSVLDVKTSDGQLLCNAVAHGARAALTPQIRHDARVTRLPMLEYSDGTTTFCDSSEAVFSGRAVWGDHYQLTEVKP